MLSRRRNDAAFTLVELLVIIIILATLVAVLLPVLSRVRRQAVESRIKSEQQAALSAVEAQPPGALAGDAAERSAAAPVPSVPLARVRSFDATIDLTPRLSVGTDQPESIYEASFAGTLVAGAPRGSGDGDCALHLPLPPQIISLGDVRLSVNGEPSEALELAGEQLVWHGRLPAEPVDVKVGYTAVGRGLYALQTPPGKIIDRFTIELTADGSDVRMLELSLQPTGHSRDARRTTYVWDYQRLMFGRPIAVDVLGIAPIDRLGELSWLGPVSVAAFGVVIGLMSRAFESGNFNRWMLLLVLGTFTGAYPLMYFAQQFIPLRWAMLLSGGLVIAIIAVRLTTIVGWRLGLFGMTLPAAAIMALTLLAAVQPQLQGIVLTTSALGLAVLAMALAPRFVSEPIAEPVPA